MKIILAFDSFKGSLSSAEANAAAAEALQARWPQAQVLKLMLSDGGEGWVAAFHGAWGGELVSVAAHDPLMRRIEAHYLRHGDTAVIEVAQASGLTLLAPEERNPLRATSYGTGELVAHALRQGCKRFIVGLGGSATSDAGIGMIRALIDHLAPGGRFDDIVELRSCRFILGSDVRNPLCGEDGAAAVFGPQKGADSAMVRALDERACRFADISARHFGYDKRNEPGAGAAGGLGYAFMQYMGARAVSGAELLLDTIGFDKLVADAGLVITGEGAADRQTLMGKLPAVVLSHARKAGVPVWLLAGRVSDKETLLAEGFARVSGISPSGLSLSEAMEKETAFRNLRKAISEMLEGYK